MTDIPEEWPESGWYKNIAAFCNLIQKTGGFWCMDMNLKYLNFRVDTRTGHFAILDNERAKDITAERILKAMKQWVDECGWNNENEHIHTLETEMLHEMKQLAQALEDTGHEPPQSFYDVIKKAEGCN